MQGKKLDMMDWINSQKITSITSQIIFRIHMLPLFKQKRDVQKVTSVERRYTIARDGFQPHKQELLHITNTMFADQTDLNTQTC